MRIGFDWWQEVNSNGVYILPFCPYCNRGSPLIVSMYPYSTDLFKVHFLNPQYKFYLFFINYFIIICFSYSMFISTIVLWEDILYEPFWILAFRRLSIFFRIWTFYFMRSGGRPVMPVAAPVKVGHLLLNFCTCNVFRYICKYYNNVRHTYLLFFPMTQT